MLNRGVGITVVRWVSTCGTVRRHVDDSVNMSSSPAASVAAAAPLVWGASM